MGCFSKKSFFGGRFDLSPGTLLAIGGFSNVLEASVTFKDKTVTKAAIKVVKKKHKLKEAKKSCSTCWTNCVSSEEDCINRKLMAEDGRYYTPGDVDPKRIYEEVSILTTMQDHPNVAKLFGVFDYFFELWMILEFYPYEMHKIIEKVIPNHENGTILAVQLLIPIASALQHMHDKRIIHKDVKTENLLVSSNGVPKICDFGLSVQLPDGESTTTEKIKEGTRYYMAPELIREEPYGFAVDAFAFAMSAICCAYCGGLGPNMYLHSWQQTMELYKDPVVHASDLQEISIRFLQGTTQLHNCIHDFHPKGWEDIAPTLEKMLDFDQNERATLVELLSLPQSTKCLNNWKIFMEFGNVSNELSPDFLLGRECFDISKSLQNLT